MQAFILAAGLGTRLRPLTHDKPKALVEVGGIPMLERVATRLVTQGFSRLVINVHHFADRVKSFVDEKDGFGAEEVFISHEKEKALETGGGIKQARQFLSPDQLFLVHNVDILTDMDVRRLYEEHVQTNALATMAVRPAETHRVLLFDQEKQLCGYGAREDGELITVREPQGAVSSSEGLPSVRDLEHMDFMGVQVISPDIFELMTETGVFSIINVYIRLVQEGHVVRYFLADGNVWIDIGTHERLEKANELVGRA